MPETLSERLIASVMLVVTVMLIVLVVREARRYYGPEPVALVANQPPTSAPASPAPAPASPAPAPRAVRPKPVTKLLLSATGGDTWFTVRTGSAQGKVLYTGTLAQGRSLTVSGKQLWLRFGSAANLTAQLNGNPLPLLPGTYSALVSPEGLRQVPG